LKEENNIETKLSVYELKKFNFETLIHSINRCYAKEVQQRLPKATDFPKTIFDSNNNLNLQSLIEFAKSKNDIYFLSVAKRIKGVRLIQFSRDENTKIELKSAWKMISESILDIPSECTVSSIGSQGFLSIPIFKYDSEMNGFDFIRLHIWENSLLEHIDTTISERFSIHSHSFLAQSWIINGKIINERYSVNETAEKSDSSLFKIEYNKTLNEVNQHTSMAVNTSQNIEVEKASREEYVFGETYKIDAGKYHKSISLGENGLSATFFSFTTQNNNVVQSNVTGPSSMQTSKINRKMHIDPKNLIKTIDLKLNSYD
jgi:hypothetical protein